MRKRPTDRMNRRQVAELLDVHPDSVSRRLADGTGLASAVLAWGGRGKSMQFSRTLVLRWWRSSICTKRDGRPCDACALVLEDARAVGEHLHATRHGAEGCMECTPPGRLCQPCA